jgi:hypothetical protein
MVGKALALATGLSFSMRDTYNVIAIGSGTFMRRYDYKTKRDLTRTWTGVAPKGRRGRFQ